MAWAAPGQYIDKNYFDFIDKMLFKFTTDILRAHKKLQWSGFGSQTLSLTPVM